MNRSSFVIRNAAKKLRTQMKSLMQSAAKNYEIEKEIWQQRAEHFGADAHAEWARLILENIKKWDT